MHLKTCGLKLVSSLFVLSVNHLYITVSLPLQVKLFPTWADKRSYFTHDPHFMNLFTIIFQII